MTVQTKLNVVAQKADPSAVIEKGTFVGGYFTNIINVMEDGTERPYRISDKTKKGVLKDLAKLPISNIKGMWVDESGSTLLELFKYNGV